MTDHTKAASQHPCPTCERDALKRELDTAQAPFSLASGKPPVMGAEERPRTQEEIMEELRQCRRDVEAMTKMCDSYAAENQRIADERDALQRELDAAYAAVIRYGGHEPSCGFLTLRLSDPPIRNPCTCGLAAVLAKAKGSQ